MKLLLLGFLVPVLAFAHTSTWKDNVDGLDLWEIQDPAQVQTSITNFKEKCATEIPARISRMIDELGANSSEFSLKTRTFSKVHRGFGTSYYCELTAKAAKNSYYYFSEAYKSGYFFDIIDPATNEVIKTNVEQCKEYSHELEANAGELKIFARHALMVWAKNPTNGKYVEACFVKYTRLLPRK